MFIMQLIASPAVRPLQPRRPAAASPLAQPLPCAGPATPRRRCFPVPPRRGTQRRQLAAAGSDGGSNGGKPAQQLVPTGEEEEEEHGGGSSAASASKAEQGISGQDMLSQQQQQQQQEIPSPSPTPAPSTGMGDQSYESDDDALLLLAELDDELDADDDVADGDEDENNAAAAAPGGEAAAATAYDTSAGTDGTSSVMREDDELEEETEGTAGGGGGFEWDGLGTEDYGDGEYDDDLGAEALDQSGVMQPWDLVRLYEGRDAAPTLAELERCFPFALDKFQKRSVQYMLEGNNVVVSAPTGAGKTAIADAAAIACLARGKRVIYTTPLKALSNQKLYEMRERFGIDSVGLQTGDASLRPDAHLVVMTTEILRNIMYRDEVAATSTASTASISGVSSGEQAVAAADSSSSSSSSEALGQQQQQQGGSLSSVSSAASTPSPSSSSARLADVGLVVLDEVHYLGDPNRGSVWEEVIINCPPHVQLLAMSATVRNPEDLGGWVSKVHGNCETVIGRTRPVPLTWQFCHNVRGNAVMMHLLSANGKKVNPMLLPVDAKAAKKADLRRGGGKAAARSRYLSEVQDEEKGGWGRQDQLEEWQVDGKEPMGARVPDMEGTLQLLRERDMLPAIWFIFSRKDCDLAAIKAAGVRQGAGGEGPKGMTNQHERDIIQRELAALQATQPEAVKQPLVGPLLAGVASHHAGCLPAWKTLVEGLFQMGVLKVVFATETLAAGINMPARCTVISSMARRRDGAISLLTHNELLQMAGRAGRRGYDTVGHAVLLQTRFEGPREAVSILRAGPEPLRSQFSTGYGMALSLLASRSLEEAREFVQRSFSNYLGGEGSVRRVEEIEMLEAAARAELAGTRSGGKGSGGGRLPADISAKAEEQGLQEYNKLQGKRKEERRALRMLQAQAADARAAAAAARMAALGLPRLVGVDVSASSEADDSGPMPALCVGAIDLTAASQSKGSSKANTAYMCLSADNRILVVNPRFISAVARGDAAEGSPLAKGSPSLERLVAIVKAMAAEAGPGSWTKMESGWFHLDGTAGTAMAALQLPKAVARGSSGVLEPLAAPAEMEQAIALQRERLSQVKRQLREMARDVSSSSSSRGGARKAAAATARAAKLLQRAKRLRDEMDMSLNSSWQAFEDVVQVLVESAALDATTLRPLPLGHIARQLSGTNELWLAVLLTHPAVVGLPPAVLAGVACAAVSPSILSKPNIWAAYPPSERVMQVFEELEDDQEKVYRTQLRYNVPASLAIDLRLAGLVEAWAGGCSWQQAMADCSLDDGDVARLLSRTVDLLRQASFVPELPPQLRATARAAAKAMDRKPISDLIM